MHCCRYLSPSSNALSHKGLEASSDYRYSIDLPFDNCSHPIYQGSPDLVACAYSQGVFEDCPLVSMESPVTLRTATMVGEEDFVCLELSTYRSAAAVRIYDIRFHGILIASFNAHLDNFARHNADTEFNKTMDFKTLEERKVDNDSVSYISKVVGL